MSDPEITARRYSEKEVGLILRRATELQRAEPSAGDPAGLTLGELQEVGAEVGIDPRYLQRAAAELESRGAENVWTALAGAPIAIIIERSVSGEFPEDRFEELVPMMQTGTVGQGNASAVGKTLTWSSRSDTNTSSQQVLVTSRNGKTVVRIEERLAGFAGGIFGGLMGGVGGGVGLGVGGALGGVLGSVALGVAFPIAVIGASYGAARAIFGAHYRKRKRHMEDLMNRLVEQIENEMASRTIPPRSGD